MAIRTSITAPNGAATKAFNRAMRGEALPETPSRRPPASEREPLIAALKAIPVGATMSRKTWVDRFVEPYVRTKHTLWGIDFGIYPAAITNHDDSKTCNGVFVRAITRNRRGVQPMFTIKGPFGNTWFRQILDWVEENYYEGPV